MPIKASGLSSSARSGHSCVDRGVMTNCNEMKYANKRGFTYVLMPGDEEREKHMISIKDFTSGEQKMMALAACIDFLKES